MMSDYHEKKVCYYNDDGDIRHDVDEFHGIMYCMY